MTGEITLRGRVLPIGGLKEKLLAALRAGITTVFIPKENEKDLAEIPDSVKKGLKIVPVSHVDEVISTALCANPNRSPGRSQRRNHRRPRLRRRHRRRRSRIEALPARRGLSGGRKAAPGLPRWGRGRGKWEKSAANRARLR